MQIWLMLDATLHIASLCIDIIYENYLNFNLFILITTQSKK